MKTTKTQFKKEKEFGKISIKENVERLEKHIKKFKILLDKISDKKVWSKDDILNYEHQYTLIGSYWDDIEMLSDVLLQMYDYGYDKWCKERKEFKRKVKELFNEEH